MHSALCRNKRTPSGLQQAGSLFDVPCAQCCACRHEIHCMLRAIVKFSSKIELPSIILQIILCSILKVVIEGR